MESDNNQKENEKDDKFITHETRKFNVNKSSGSSSVVFEYASPDDEEIRDDAT